MIGEWVTFCDYSFLGMFTIWTVVVYKLFYGYLYSKTNCTSITKILIK